LPRLRRREGYRIARRALALANRHEGVRFCHVSIQGNHLHFLVEVDDRAALTRGMRSFGISFAKNVNGRLARRDGVARRGRVLADRYHVVALRTPAQTWAALEHVLGNWRRPGEDRGGARRRTDRFSSGPFFTGWSDGAPLLMWWADLPWPEDGPLPIRFPRSWLLEHGWKRGGLLSPWATPGPQRERDDGTRTAVRLRGALGEPVPDARRGASTTTAHRDACRLRRRSACARRSCHGRVVTLASAPAAHRQGVGSDDSRGAQGRCARS
jgi:hypothetical protein